MKVTMNVECTPEEARAFFGLPDVQPLQAAMMKEMEERMRSTMQATDPASMMKMWFPAGADGMQQMQKMFWGQVQNTMQQSMTTPATTSAGKRKGGV
jgi:hypothetical protein